jgi:ABC-type Mn2+/Zn2+ transport system permease subunit
MTAAMLVVMLLALLLIQEEFLFVSFNRKMATTLGKKALFWDILNSSGLGSSSDREKSFVT